MAVVLSTTIKEASDGTAMVEATGNDVPEPAALELITTVVSTAAEPLMLAATIWLILKTLPEDAAFASSTLAVVLAGVRYAVLPMMVVTFTMFGAAMIAP